MEPPAEPPKRMTRARAARSATGETASSAAKSARASTAASKAKTTRASATSSKPVAPATRTSVKRKTRSDDNDDESEAEAVEKRLPPASRTAARSTRGPGRPKKTGQSAPQPEVAPAPARATRGRPSKKLATEAAESAAPARATRTRAKKPQDDDEETDDLAPEPVKKPTRGRPATASLTTSALASKPAVKKTVKFAEPDKENVVPATGVRSKTVQASKPADAPATGMRANPVRKPAAASRPTKMTTTKKTTASKESEEKQVPLPLSPKKVTQISASRDRDVDSEDELAMDRAPARPFHRSPVKPPVNVRAPTKTNELTSAEDEEAVSLPPTESAVLLSSPVRRLPQSHFKDSLKSPAKRVEGLHLDLPSAEASSLSGTSPSKSSLLQSPAKRLPLPTKSLDVGSSSSWDQTSASPFKQSLFHSPAKRPFSPFKPIRAPVIEEPTEPRSPALTPVLLCSPPAAEQNEASEETSPDEPVMDSDTEDEAGTDPLSPSRPEFNGRMSTVLPRAADPALIQATEPGEETVDDDDHETIIVEDQSEQVVVDVVETAGEPMLLDDHKQQVEEDEEEEEEALGDISTTPPDSPPQETLNMFGLRQRDMNPFDTSYSESEDGTTRIMTPNNLSPVKELRGSVMRPRTSGFGFTPLARRFDEWKPRSPLKQPKTTGSTEDPTQSQDSSVNNDFFEDEMCVRPGAEVNDSAGSVDPPDGVPEIKTPVLEDISITDEDLELAAEANEMSVMSPEQVESMLNLDGNDDTMSEASQEYGDENANPGQHSHGGTAAAPPVTPQRFIRREFHTVSKIPLKPSDESTPPAQPSLKKRRHSISRVQVTRPSHGLSRSATVISYSPPQDKHIDVALEEAVEEESVHERSGSVPPPETPSKSEVYSKAESTARSPARTPARTPGRGANSTILRGAVVFVDVHTVDGADASAIFVELLTQMGAQCVDSWDWDPSDESASSNIGITHVVFKDGGVRTVENVRQTDGVVQCVGVGWVLDCERANEWLDESPYCIDTSPTPRGGAHRRKTMEPRSLANRNGQMAPSPATRSSSDRQNVAAPITPAPGKRRESSLWMHSPDDDGVDFNEDEFDFDIANDQDWYATAPLTPVPKTPAPEAIHRFAMDVTPDTAMGDGEDDEESIGVDEMLSREQLLQRTCPPKAQQLYHNMGAGILGLQRDESVARRLMDARRKSLAFAPKVSSPLAKTWKEWN